MFPSDIAIMDKPRVYLAGPIFQQTDAVCNDWRAKFKACEMFDWLDPMSRDYRGREDECVSEIVENDKDDIDSCAAIVARVDPVSAGTSMEILWAWLNHSPVIVIRGTGRVSPWVRYHATDICANEEAALQKLKELFA
jgi:nucleoside 2-deoxyribosyltransferase